MTEGWQVCQGDYIPGEVFEQEQYTVLTRNIQILEEGVWTWEEYRVLTKDYKAIKATLVKDEDAIEKTAATLDYVAMMTDVEIPIEM